MLIEREREGAGEGGRVKEGGREGERARERPPGRSGAPGQPSESIMRPGRRATLAGPDGAQTRLVGWTIGWSDRAWPERIGACPPIRPKARIGQGAAYG